MADVSISYVGADGRAATERIADALEVAGISCWYEAGDLRPPGVAGRIARSIKTCRVFLLVWDEAASRSAYIESETALALRRVLNEERVTLLLFRMDRTPLPPLLRRFQSIDGPAPDADRVRDLVEQTARILGRESVTAASRRPSGTV